MYQRILIPLDGSPIAEQAVPLAKMLAVRFQSTVVLLQAIQPVNQKQVQGTVLHGNNQVELLQRQAREYLERVAHEFPGGLSVQHEVQIGLPATAILEFAESAHMDLITMATHGRTGVQRWAYGSVADKVLSGARLPILLVPASQAPPAMTSIERILVPLDGSALAERALTPAQQLAQAFDAELVLFRVQEPTPYGQGEATAGIFTAAVNDAVRATVEEYLVQKTQEMQSRGVRVSWATQFGTPAEGILGVAHDRAANLVVMSTHGRSGVGRWIMGSVADRVLRASRIPVLLIRSTAILGEG